MLTLLYLAALDYSSVMKSSVTLIVFAGFLLAVTLGSIAWFNSKKPAGWENAETPDWIPKVGDQTSETDETDA